MKKYTSIDRLPNVVKSVRKLNAMSSLYIDPVSFVGTVKLHGTNAGVRVNKDGTVEAQSRERILTPEDDNYSWAKFVQRNTEVFKFIAEGLLNGKTETITIFGELIGPGIQKKVAISQIPQRLFVIFGALVGDGEGASYLPEGRFTENPRNMVSQDPAKTLADHNIYFIGQVPSYKVTIDFLCEKSIQDALEYTENLAEEIGKSCPFGALHGVKGVGEGAVFKPVGKYSGDTLLYFKSKSDEHKVFNDPREKPTIDPLVSENVAVFVKAFVTTARLEQGVSELDKEGHKVVIQSTGKFLQWMNIDIKKESVTELELSGLQWKTVSKAISTLSKEYWQRKLRDPTA